MSTELFGRQITVFILDFDQEEVIQISDLHIEFDIQLTMDKEPNTANITIFNLGESNRNLLSEKRHWIEVEAGYGDSEIGQRVIFRGRTTKVSSVLDSATWVTEIEAEDGIKKRANRIIFEETYTKGTSYSLIIKKIAQKANLTLLLDAELSNHFLLKGRSFFGPVLKVLDEAVDLFGKQFNYNITFGTLEVYKKKNGIAGFLEVPKIDRESGMIGFPSKTEEGVIVSTLLDKEIIPNRFVLIDMSSMVNDLTFKDQDRIKTKRTTSYDIFLVYSVNHTGTNRDGEFRSEVVGITDYVTEIAAEKRKEQDKKNR